MVEFLQQIVTEIKRSEVIDLFPKDENKETEAIAASVFVMSSVSISVYQLPAEDISYHVCLVGLWDGNKAECQKQMEGLWDIMESKEYAEWL